MDLEGTLRAAEDARFFRELQLLRNKCREVLLEWERSQKPGTDQMVARMRQMACLVHWKERP